MSKKNASKNIGIFNWNDLDSVFNYRWDYQLEVIKELEVALNKKLNKCQIELGGLIEEGFEPENLAEFCISNIKESFLRGLLELEYLTSIVVKCNHSYDISPHTNDEYGYDSEVAYIDFDSKKLKDGLSSIKPHIERMSLVMRDIKNPMVVLRTYSQINGQIVVEYKDKIYKLRKPNAGSENDDFFEYVSKRPGIKISGKEIRAHIKDLSKPVTAIIDQLGFSKSLRDIFFTRSSKEQIIFNNNFTKSDLIIIDFDWDKVKKELEEFNQKNHKRS